MTLKDLEGIYNIIGKNQEDTDESYNGALTLSLNEQGRVLAKWLINGEQEQYGSGFFKDDILVINFSYMGDDNELLKGIVVYRCLTKDILDGFWSEKHGNPLYLGEERCFRVKEQEKVFD